MNELTDPSQVTYAVYYDVRMKQYYSPKLNNVVFLGDAAHAMSPVLGQGVNLALQGNSYKVHFDKILSLTQYFYNFRRILFLLYVN